MSGKGPGFLEQAAHRNTLYLLAYYAGELIGRARGKAPQWSNWLGLVDSLRNVNLGPGFHNGVVCRFEDLQRELPWFLPLHALLVPLFDAQAAGLVSVCRPYLPTGIDARQALPPRSTQAHCLPRHWPPDPESLGRLLLRPPAWIEAQGDPLREQFVAAPRLLAEGRVLTGVIVQANDDLFEAGDLPGAPAMVVYDPTDRVALHSLQAIAHQLFALKGQAHGDPACTAFGRLLADDLARCYDLAVPTAISPWPLRCSTLYIDRRSLPDGVLQSVLPLLYSERCSGRVMLLPPAHWPDWLEDVWLARGRERDGRQRSQGEVITDLHDRGFEREQAAQRLFDEGFELLHSDPKRAMELFGQATREGHVIAKLNLGVCHHNGLGTRVDLPRARAWFEVAAREGEPEAMVNLGNMLWHGRGGRKDRPRARQLYQAARERGNARAVEVLDYLENAGWGRRMLALLARLLNLQGRR